MEKVYSCLLGNFLVVIKVKDTGTSAVYNMIFSTQDGHIICDIPMSSEIFFNLIDVLRWYGIDEAFLYDFPPHRMFEQYTIGFSYPIIEEDIYDEERDYSKIEIEIFKDERKMYCYSKQESILHHVVSYEEFTYFVQFLINILEDKISAYYK